MTLHSYLYEFIYVNWQKQNNPSVSVLGQIMESPFFQQHAIFSHIWYLRVTGTGTESFMEKVEIQINNGD